MKKLIALFLGFVVFGFGAIVAEAHRSGCHRWHTCPSDTGSYSMEYDSSGDTVPYCGSSMYMGTDGKCHYYTTYSAPAPAVASPTIKYVSGGYFYGAELTCYSGNVKRGGQCVTHTEDCRLSFGNNVTGAPGTESNSLCYCAAGYSWNSSKTACILPTQTASVISSGPSQEVLMAQIEALLKTITELQNQIAALGVKK